MNDNNNICPDPPCLRFNAIYYLDRPFILTTGNLLKESMPYLYKEGSYIAGVRIKNISVKEDWIYLELQELDSDRKFNVSWNLAYEGNYYLWTLADLPTLSKLSK